MDTTALVDNLPPSHQQALSILQRSESTPSTDVEQGQFQQKVLNILNNNTTADDFVEECKSMAQAALDVDSTFNSVGETLSFFVFFAFPLLLPQAVMWGQMRQRWNAKPGGLLSDSIKLAIFTSSQLDTYNIFLLQLVEDVKTEQDVKNAQAELRKFSTQQPPPDVNTNLVDRFKDLRNDVKEFEERVNNILHPGISGGVISVLHSAIKQPQSDIEKLNDQIGRVLAITSAASPSFGLAKVFIAVSDAGKLLQQRAEKKTNLDKVLGQFKETNTTAVATAGDFLITLASYESYITLLCDNLATLATVWAEARFEAVDFANKLDGGLQVAGTAAFKLTLKVARETAVLLKDGLKVYADVLS